MAEKSIGIGVLPWRVVVCFALGMFFLYNPFFTICPSAGPAAVLQHHVSYRSTVASSELGCSTVQHSKLSVAPVATLVAIQRVLLEQTRDAGPRPSEETVRATSPDLASALWSRPPPLL